MNGIKFIIDPKSYDRDTAYVAHIFNINSKEELFKVLGNKLRFPSYFGLNWDALLDMLCDFSWIEEKDIVLVHDELPVLDEADLQTYVEILSESIKSWQNSERHNLEVIFPERVKDLI